MHSFYGTRLSENMAKTPEGYLICYDVNIARIGTQEYLGSELGVDEEVVVVNRPAEEVFKPATIASFEGKPFTNDHPYELLDVSNTSIYEKGHVQNVRISDDKTYIIADIMVKDAQTIRDIENGKRELSAGYNCDCMQNDDGNWYQCNIIGNHVALVDKGRAGNKVRINDNEWKEQDHPRGEDGKFTSGGGSNGSSNLSSDDKRGIDVALTMYGQEYEKRGNKETYKKAQELKEKIKNNEKLSADEVRSIKVALNSTGSEQAESIAKRLDETFGMKKYSFTTGKEFEGVSNKANTVKNFLNTIYEAPFITKEQSRYIEYETGLKFETISNIIDLTRPEGSDDYDTDKASKDIARYSNLNSFLEEHYEDGIITKSEAERLKKETGFTSEQVIGAIESVKPKNSDDYDIKEVLDVLIKQEGNKEKKPMKDKNTVLGKLLKAFARDAQPEEMVEAIKAVKGEDVEPEGDKVAQLEAKVAELEAKLEKLYTAEKQEEQGEMHALDELEKELTDEDPKEDDPKEEIKDADAKNDPKLIEAIAEKAQNDEETVEEIKKEIADAKKVIASIEDKNVRLAVADSFAKVIRGKMTSSENYKKLMDASKKSPVVDNKRVDYNETFKKIKENKFRK